MAKPIILVVDNDENIRKLAAEVLISIHPFVGVEYCDNGEDLMNYLKGEKEYFPKRPHTPPAMIILDSHLPKKDGFSVLKEIKSCPDFKKIPVIMYTTSEDTEDYLHAHKLGVDEYINKSNNFVYMMRIFKELLNKHLK